VESGGSAACDANCGNGSVDSGEDCDGTELDGETCSSLGYDQGDLACTSSCTFDESDCETCTEEADEQCDGGHPYYYDSCGERGDRIDTCSSSETCLEKSGSATCDANCGNGSVDSGEDCDGTELGGSECTDLGYDGGDLGCSSSCTFDESSCCEDEAYTQCYGGDVYYYDSCDDRGSKKEDCGTTSGCEDTSSTSAECTYEAIDNTSTPTSCGSDAYDIFTAVDVDLDDVDTDPSLEVTWEKCDGSSFSSSKTCHVRVGSYSSSGVVRVTTTVSKGESSWTTTFDGWPSKSDFEADGCGTVKQFYFTCDDGSSTAHWVGKTPVEIEKDCP